MFNKNKDKIEELRSKIEIMERRQYEFLEHANKMLISISDQSKKSYVWDLQKEEIELMDEGRKMKAIRNIVK